MTAPMPDPLLFEVAANPDPDSSLPLLIRLPLPSGELVLKAGDSWPRTAKVYCHRTERWPENPQIVERIAVRSCQRRGGAIDLVLDRARENRSQLVFTRIQGGREAIFWQSARTTRQARPGIRVPRRRAAELAHLTILVDTRERYPYKFAHQQATTQRRALPAGDYGIAHEEQIVAVVERKSLADLVRRLIDGQLTYAFADMASLPRAAWSSRIATPTCSSSSTPDPGSPPNSSQRSPSAIRPCRSLSARHDRSPRNGPSGSSALRSPTTKPTTTPRPEPDPCLGGCDSCRLPSPIPAHRTQP